MRQMTGLSIAAVLVVLALAGCDSAEEPSPATSAPAQSTSPASTSPDDVAITSSGPVEAEPDDSGQQAAADAVVDFWAMLDELSQDPSVDIAELTRVARGQAVKQWASNIQGRRDRDSVQTGDTLVTVTDVETVEDAQRYEVTTCLDFSDVQFDGVTPERRFDDGAQITYVVRPDALSEGELFVTDDPLEYEPCAS